MLWDLVGTVQAPGAGSLAVNLMQEHCQPQQHPRKSSQHALPGEQKNNSNNNGKKGIVQIREGSGSRDGCARDRNGYSCL